jgi:hypothetical protein
MAWTLGAASVLLVGCLFPSFEGMEGAPKQEQPLTGRADGGGDGEEERLADGGAAARAPAASAVADGLDSGAVSQVTPSPAQIACGREACNAETSYCCSAITGTTCRRSGESSLFCTSTLRCGSSSDCKQGVCCAIGPDAACRSDCSFGQIVCDPKAPQCPSSRPKCSMKIGSPGGFQTFFCGF